MRNISNRVLKSRLSANDAPKKLIEHVGRRTLCATLADCPSGLLWAFYRRMPKLLNEEDAKEFAAYYDSRHEKFKADFATTPLAKRADALHRFAVNIQGWLVRRLTN